MQYRSDQMKKLTAVMISFLRPEYTSECIKSLKAEYPDIGILVAENGKFDQGLSDLIKSVGGRYIRMPFDSGVSVARNTLVRMAGTEYVMVGDDDFYYSKCPAKVPEMLALLDKKPEFALIGGRVIQAGKIMDYQGFIDIEKDHYRYRALDVEGTEYEYDKESDLRYTECNLVLNYFVARVKDIIDVPWDENIKVSYEHSDWFISMYKAERRVLFTPDAICIHKPPHVQIARKLEYQKYRHRSEDNLTFFDKHGIRYVIGFNGHKLHRKTAQEARMDKRAIRLGKFKPDVRNDKRVYRAINSCVVDGKIFNAGDIVRTKHSNPNLELMK